MTTKKKRRTIRHDPFGRMALAIAAYLEREGWTVELFGGHRVQRQPGGRTSDYESVLRFRGGPKEKPKPATRGAGVPGSRHGDLPQRITR